MSIVDKRLQILMGQQLVLCPEKTTPVAADTISISDSAEQGSLKKVTIANLKSVCNVSNNGSSLTSGKIPVASTGGVLVDVTPQTELIDELTTITFTAPGVPDYAIQDLVQNTGFGFVTKDEGNTVLSVIANLQARVNGLETKLVALGLLNDAD